jgi:hypothetical protein
VSASDLLGFAGIDAVIVPALAVEQHLAEKLHAYSRVYAGDQPSSRVKDLVDVVVIARTTSVDGDRLTEAVTSIFERRGMHPVRRLPAPPSAWVRPWSVLVAHVRADRELAAGAAAARRSGTQCSRPRLPGDDGSPALLSGARRIDLPEAAARRPDGGQKGHDGSPGHRSPQAKRDRRSPRGLAILDLRRCESRPHPGVRLGSPDGPLRFLPDDVETWLELERRSWLPGESATRATSRAARSTPVRTAQLRIDALAGDP